MSKSVRILFSDEQDRQLTQWADEEGLSVQDYIRRRLFNVDTIFTPPEAARRALAYPKGTRFNLPMLYGEEWALHKEAGVNAGSFGKQFARYVAREYAGEIEDMGQIDGKECYRRIGD